MKLSVAGQTVHHSTGSVLLAYPVVEAHELGSIVLVLFDYMSFPRNEPARNLFAYDHRGQLLWRAEDIGYGAVDAYTGVISEVPLVIGNVAGFACEIELSSGRVLTTRFMK